MSQLGRQAFSLLGSACKHEHILEFMHWIVLTYLFLTGRNLEQDPAYKEQPSPICLEPTAVVGPQLRSRMTKVKWDLPWRRWQILRRDNPGWAAMADSLPFLIPHHLLYVYNSPPGRLPAWAHLFATPGPRFHLNTNIFTTVINMLSRSWRFQAQKRFF